MVSEIDECVVDAAQPIVFLPELGKHANLSNIFSGVSHCRMQA
jgi:hypothetical protein